METAKLGRIDVKSIHASGCRESRFAFSRRSAIAVSLLFGGILLSAQQQSQSPYPDGTQNPSVVNQYNPNSPDCSDPAQASLPACSELNPSATSLQNPQSRLPLSQVPRLGQQPELPTGTYSDLEQLSRQGAQLAQPPLPAEMHGRPPDRATSRPRSPSVVAPGPMPGQRRSC